MHKILITIAVTGLLVLFGMQNSDHVPVSLIFGSPTKVRLVFLLAIAAVFGFLVSYIRGLAREIQLKKEIRRLDGLCQTALARSGDDDDDDFDDDEDDWRRAS